MVCELHEAGNPALWVNRSAVYPWITPAAPDAFETLFLEHGQSRALKAREILQSEDAPYDKAYLVRRGCIGQAVVNPMVYHKTLAMNLFTPGRIMGCINLFTGTASPRRLIAVTGSEVLAMPKTVLQGALADFPDLLRQMAAYAELSAKSELMGMELLFTMPAEVRLQALFAVQLLSYEKIDLQGRIAAAEPQPFGEGYAQLPISMTRENMRLVTYLSQVTFDRLFAEWLRKGFLKRDEHKVLWVQLGRLSDALKWIQRKNF